jgi:small subunit ribosomal protein S6
MKNYEAMIVLDTKGKEESVDTLVTGVKAEIEKSGGKVEKVETLGKKKFPYAPRHVEGGWFINIFFQSEVAGLDALRNRLKLNENVYQQYYQVRA